MTFRFLIYRCFALMFVLALSGCKNGREAAPAPPDVVPPAAALPAPVQPAEVAASTAVVAPLPVNLLQNGAFAHGLSNWLYWMDAAQATEQVQVVTGAVRLVNPAGKMVGIRQTTAVESGAVYRLSGEARSMVTNDSNCGFGARLAFFLPPQKELEIVWMSEYNFRLPKDIVFTNQVTGTATVFAHLGFGGFASTGEFSSISLEKLK
jgi:hypothetical protein